MVAKPVKGPDMDRVYQLAEAWTAEGGRLDVKIATAKTRLDFAETFRCYNDTHVYVLNLHS